MRALSCLLIEPGGSRSPWSGRANPSCASRHVTDETLSPAISDLFGDRGV
jgi:hypothetical protein